MKNPTSCTACDVILMIVALLNGLGLGYQSITSPSTAEWLGYALLSLLAYFIAAGVALDMLKPRGSRAGTWAHIKAFYLGLTEFRSAFTTRIDHLDLQESYDKGRELAHRLTLRRFES